ncbi:hypothetical protein WDU94_012240 [Cyamophila willieti]
MDVKPRDRRTAVEAKCTNVALNREADDNTMELAPAHYRTNRYNIIKQFDQLYFYNRKER